MQQELSWRRAPVWATKYIAELRDGRPYAFWASEDELTTSETLVEVDPPRTGRLVLRRPS